MNLYTYQGHVATIPPRRQPAGPFAHELGRATQSHLSFKTCHFLGKEKYQSQF